VIVQTSVKTVRQLGAEFLVALFNDRANRVSAPVSLHLDHCPFRDVITECLEAGFSSVLFDASDRPFGVALAETVEVVAEAHAHGATVESEIERIMGVEDGVGSDSAGPSYPLERIERFVDETGIDYFAPAVGTAHGQYTVAPVLTPERITELVDTIGIPQVLHGGTGLAEADFADMSSRGCAKINVSTALKEAYMKGALAHLVEAEEKGKWDPPSLFASIEQSVREMAEHHMNMFGSAGRA
jgi:fructose-bisphosphate aldolase class II